MEIDVTNGAFQVVMESVDLSVVIGDSAKIDVGQAVEYIKSGQAEIEKAVDDGTAAFNANAIAKTNAFNQNASDKTTAFDNNAISKTSDFNTNATDKTNAFNSNATDKTTAFNNNASTKTTDFNDNYTAKLGDFNSNASDKTGDFNSNASDKTSDFNDNYVAKKQIIDDAVSDAQGYATSASGYAATAKQYAIGDPSEPAGNSAKYWAEQASSSLSGLTSRVTTIEGKIPSDASSSNQLADKAWVGNQGYITGITSGDVTTALGYTPYDATNPDGFISGITSGDVTTALGYTPYDASNPSGYTSNVGTVTSVNNTSPDGTGNVTLTLPDPLPSQTGQSGKYLTTDGTSASWANVDALPSQTGQSGKYLTTDGSSASWATLSVNPDNKSINKNASDQLQTIGVINQNDTTTALKVWSGDEADLPVSKDPNTFYATEETVSVSLLETLYPVGSVYITTNATCPLSTLIAGSTWELQSTGIVQAGDIPCKGNGITLGLTDGTDNYGLNLSSYGANPIAGTRYGAYDKNVGTVVSSDSSSTSMKALGITTDPTKSGIIADTSSLTLAVNIFERTA